MEPVHSVWQTNTLTIGLTQSMKTAKYFTYLKWRCSRQQCYFNQFYLHFHQVSSRPRRRLCSSRPSPWTPYRPDSATWTRSIVTPLPKHGFRHTPKVTWLTASFWDFKKLRPFIVFMTSHIVYSQSDLHWYCFLAGLSNDVNRQTYISIDQNNPVTTVYSYSVMSIPSKPSTTGIAKEVQ